MKKIFILLLLVCLLLLSCSESHTSMPVKSVNTESGRVKGVPGRNVSVMVYKGIPYAAPPVGNLRWKPPVPVTPWDGVRLCDKFGSNAMQAPQAPFMMWSKEFIVDTSLGYSEDCLTLNLWTQKDSSSAKKPVVVFIHGGAYTSGGSSCEVYDGESLAGKGVVVVTVNYRLGIFGFFAHPALSAESEHNVSGNYGILDMIAALKWVKNNIAEFGGDPDNITIQGQSAGASAVNVLLLSPLAKGLFHRAVPQSFSQISRKMAVLSEMEAAGKNSAVTDNNGTPMDRSDDRTVMSFGSRSLEEMRAVKAEDLLNVAYPASPNVDGYVIPSDMLEILKSGKQNDVPVLTGMVEADAMLFGGRSGAGQLTLDKYKKSAQEKYGEFAGAYLKAYPAENNGEAAQKLRESAEDELNVLSCFFAIARALKGTSSTYLYYFTHVMPGPDSKAHGAFHTSDVPYFLNYFSPLRKDYWSKQDYETGGIMSDYLADFIKTGNPNGRNLPEWPVWKDGEMQVMELGDTFAPAAMKKEKADFWKAYYNDKLGL